MDIFFTCEYFYCMCINDMRREKQGSSDGYEILCNSNKILFFFFTIFLKLRGTVIDLQNSRWEPTESAFHFLTVILWSIPALCPPICVFTVTLCAWHRGISHHGW